MNFSTENLLAAGLFLFFLALALTTMVRSHRRSTQLIQQWAAQHGCSVLTQQISLFKSPFFWTSGRADQVYRLTLRDAAGQVQEGWVKVGGGWRGIWNSQAQIEWKGASGAPPPLPVMESRTPE